MKSMQNMHLESLWWWDFLLEACSIIVCVGQIWYWLLVGFFKTRNDLHDVGITLRWCRLERKTVLQTKIYKRKSVGCAIIQYTVEMYFFGSSCFTGYIDNKLSFNFWSDTISCNQVSDIPYYFQHWLHTCDFEKLMFHNYDCSTICNGNYVELGV